MVTELMSGGDVESLIQNAADHRLSVEQTIKIAQETCGDWSSPTAGALSTVT